MVRHKNRFLVVHITPEKRGHTKALADRTIHATLQQTIHQLYGEQGAVTEVAHGFFAVNPPAQNNAADVNLTQAAAVVWVSGAFGDWHEPWYS